MPRATIEEALEYLRAGRPIIVVDDEHRENKGDLCVAAELATLEHVDFMCRYGSGLVCVSLESPRLDALNLPLMVPPGLNRSPHATAFATSVDARYGITTGISAHDRARTVRVLVDPVATAADLVRPGHVFPLRARPGGVLARRGHTEAAVDLARLAGLEPAGVLCEILKSDGAMARRPDLQRFARRHGLKMISIEDLVQYREEHTIVGSGRRPRSRPGMAGSAPSATATAAWSTWPCCTAASRISRRCW